MVINELGNCEHRMFICQGVKLINTTGKTIDIMLNNSKSKLYKSHEKIRISSSQ